MSQRSSCPVEVRWLGPSMPTHLKWRVKPSTHRTIDKQTFAAWEFMNGDPLFLDFEVTMRFEYSSPYFQRDFKMSIAFVEGEFTPYH